MRFPSLLPSVTLLALFQEYAYSLPVSRPSTPSTFLRAVSVEKVKRTSEAGPKIGGANFPDPSIISVNNVWYAFATRTKGSSIHIQVASSSDFDTWKLETDSDGAQLDALPNLPSWVDASSPNTWAPDVNELSDGTFVMYFSATTNEDTSKHCVGAATSRSITGPYTATSNSALICPLSKGGAIDASGFFDFDKPSGGWTGGAWEEDTKGQRYIVYKIDGNSIGNGGACGNTVEPIVATPLILQPVAADGITLQGSTTTLLNNDGESDDGIIEAPSIIKSIPGTSNGTPTYVLYFSSGCYTTGDYTVSYATSTSVTGPFTRNSKPLLATGSFGLSAPGGGDAFRSAQQILFHANDGNGRALYTAVVAVNGDSVSV